MIEDKKNNKIENIFSNQKGMALLTTLIFVFLLVTFAVALLTMTSNDTKLSALQRDSTSAFYLAETGIDKTLWYLNTSSDDGIGGLDWRTYNDEGPLNGYADTDGYLIENYPSGLTNYYKVKVKDIILSDTDLIDPIQINSYGAIYDGNKIYGKRQIQVIATIKVSQNPEVAYNHALATEFDLTLNGGISIHDGTIHSNGDITNNGTYDIDGEITAVGTITGIDGNTAVYENLPNIDFDFYSNLADDEIHGGNYYDTSVLFNTDDDSLTGIHFINGDVIIKAELEITGGAIFATGTITTLGNGSIIHSRFDYGENDPLTNNPLAIIARGDIVFGGSSISTDGIIQTDGSITINGVVTIDNGAVYADEGVLNGGGGTINITYDTTLYGQIIPGVGSEIYKILSWQEVY